MLYLPLTPIDQNVFGICTHSKKTQPFVCSQKKRRLDGEITLATKQNSLYDMTIVGEVSTLGNGPLQDELTNHLQESLTDDLDSLIEQKLLPEEEEEVLPLPEETQPSVSKYQYQIPNYLLKFNCYFQIESKEATKIPVEMSILCRSSTYFGDLLKKAIIIASVDFSEEVIRSALYMIENSWNCDGTTEQLQLSQLYSLSMLISITEFLFQYISLPSLHGKMKLYFNEIIIYAANHGKIKNILEIYYANLYPEIKNNCKNYLVQEALRPESSLLSILGKDWNLSSPQYELLASLAHDNPNTNAWEMDYNFLLSNCQSVKIGVLKNIILPSSRTLKQFVLETEKDFKNHLKTLENQFESSSIYNRRWKQIIDFFYYKKHTIPHSTRTTYVLNYVNKL